MLKASENPQLIVLWRTFERIFDGVYLHAENTKDDEEGAADEDDVADWLEGRDEGLDDQLQPWSSADHPGGSREGYRGTVSGRESKGWRE